jgi:hypothetical protein
VGEEVGGQRHQPLVVEGERGDLREPPHGRRVVVHGAHRHDAGAGTDGEGDLGQARREGDDARRGPVEGDRPPEVVGRRGVAGGRGAGPRGGVAGRERGEAEEGEEAHAGSYTAAPAAFRAPRP